MPSNRAVLCSKEVQIPRARGAPSIYKYIYSPSMSTYITILDLDRAESEGNMMKEAEAGEVDFN